MKQSEEWLEGYDDCKAGISRWRNPGTGRLQELDKEQIDRYENGGTSTADEVW